MTRRVTVVSVHIAVRDIGVASAPEPDVRGVFMGKLPQHGVNCRKVAHDADDGYLHAPDDDSAYDVDGVRYCGRCHEHL